jgi:CRISPR-associated endonuclease/helicase Cas3
LRFFDDAAQIVQEAFWHTSQRVVAQQDGTCSVTFQVSEPYEIVAWIRQWGAEVEVISPATLRQAIISDARKLSERYQELNGYSDTHQSA